MRKIFWMALVCGCVSIFLPQTSLALTLQPAVQEITVKSGETYQGFVNIENDQNRSGTFFVSVQKFIPTGEHGQQEFLPPDDTDGLPSWLHFERTSVTLAPGEAQKISFEIRVPTGTPGGGRYAAIFFSDQPRISAAAFSGSRVGALLLVSIPGATIEKVQSTKFVLDEVGRVKTHLPVSFLLELENDGNVHVMPGGDLIVTNAIGAFAARLVLNMEHGRILPGSRRQFFLHWQKSPPSDGSGFWHEVVQEWRNLGLGPYTATVHVDGPGTDDLTPQSIHFFIWPWHLLLVIGAGLLVMCLAALGLRRSRHYA